jgi:hypothetical protein
MRASPLSPKEPAMKYKTIVLEMLQQRPALHERLRRKRALLQTLDRLALELKTRHQELQTHLARTTPDRNPAPIALEAMELAIQELEDSLLDA